MQALCLFHNGPLALHSTQALPFGRGLLCAFCVTFTEIPSLRPSSSRIRPLVLSVSVGNDSPTINADCETVDKSSTTPSDAVTARLLFMRSAGVIVLPLFDGQPRLSLSMMLFHRIAKLEQVAIPEKQQRITVPARVTAAKSTAIVTIQLKKVEFSSKKAWQVFLSKKQILDGSW